MAEGKETQLQKARRELRECRRQLTEQAALNERLRQTIGYDELQGWQPNKNISKMYGWIYAWLFPLHQYLRQNSQQPISQASEKISNITLAIIAQLLVAGKYGIRIPHDPRPYDLENSFDKQGRQYHRQYLPCQVCGEDRITHEAHIIPRSEGGTNHRDNLLILCPLHHHLFDHHRLSFEEWEHILTTISNSKMESAIVYSKEVRQRLQEWEWNNAQKKQTEETHET